MTEEEVADAYRRYGSLVLRRCRRILRDDAAGEDALQEVFVRLMRYGDAFHQAESKVLWLYRVADRCCFDLLARRGARAEASTLEHAPEPAHIRHEPKLACPVCGHTPMLTVIRFEAGEAHLFARCAAPTDTS